MKKYIYTLILLFVFTETLFAGNTLYSTFDLLQEPRITDVEAKVNDLNETKINTINDSIALVADSAIILKSKIDSLSDTVEELSDSVDTLSVSLGQYVKKTDKVASDSITNLSFIKITGDTVSKTYVNENLITKISKNDTISVDSIYLQKSKIIYVDKNRTDNYTADGTVLKPYKTLSEGIAVNPDIIELSSGVYDGNGLTCNSSLRGVGTGKTSITGNITLNMQGRIENIGFTGAVISNNANAFYLTYISGSLKLLAGTSQFINSHIISTNTTALTLEGSAGLNADISSISTNGNYSAIYHNSTGQLNIVSGSVSNSSASIPAINKTNGILILNNSQIINSSLGLSIKCDAGTQNGFDGIIYAGNIQGGNIPTIVEGNYPLYSSIITGTNLIYRSASQIKNTPAGNITDTNIQDALNKLDTIKLNISDSIIITKISELKNDSGFITYAPPTGIDTSAADMRYAVKDQPNTFTANNRFQGTNSFKGDLRIIDQGSPSYFQIFGYGHDTSFYGDFNMHVNNSGQELIAVINTLNTQQIILNRNSMDLKTLVKADKGINVNTITPLTGNKIQINGLSFNTEGSLYGIYYPIYPSDWETFDNAIFFDTGDKSFHIQGNDGMKIYINSSEGSQIASNLFYGGVIQNIDEGGKINISENAVYIGGNDEKTFFKVSENDNNAILNIEEKQILVINSNGLYVDTVTSSIICSDNFVGNGSLITNISTNQILNDSGFISRSIGIKTIDDSYSININDNFLKVNTGDTDRYILLPDASLCSGNIYNIKKIDSGSGTIIIYGSESQTIDDEEFYELNQKGENLTIISDGNNWQIL